MLVLLTIHGIGFEQAPSGLATSDGYADALHEGLRAHLGAKLGDDPNRVAAGGGGPVYAQSNYPPLSHATEPGLARLGRWTASGAVDITGVSLATDGADFAHVALVYSGLEEQHGDIGALHEMAVLGMPSLPSYATLTGLAVMVAKDLEALRQHPASSGPAGPSLQPRADTVPHRGLMDRLLHRQATPAATTGTAPTASASSGASSTSDPMAGALSVLHTVEDDVAAYVARNEHRERVRMFIRDAASRLLARPDVDGIIVNGHSNGTVMGFDLVSALSPPSAEGVRWLITSGCPLRKYSDTLDWGRDAGNIRLMRGDWTNFWDPLDPVADPLAPPATWKRGQAIPTDGPGMFVVHDPDTGLESPMAVTDIQVDNVRDSKGGGLRAHNYWDNDAFCSAAGDLMLQALAGVAVSLTATAAPLATSASNVSSGAPTSA